MLEENTFRVLYFQMCLKSINATPIASARPDDAGQSPTPGPLAALAMVAAQWMFAKDGLFEC